MPDPSASEDLRFESRLARQQKRQLMIGVSLGVLVVLGGVIAYLFWPKPPERKCDDDQVQAYLRQREIPAAAVHMACEFPAPMKRMLREMASSAPEYRHLAIFKTVAENPELLTRVCPKGLGAVVDASKESPAKHAEIFLSRCNLAKTGIASKKALANAPLGRLVLATAIYGVLKDSDPKWAKRLAREVCCSGRP
jgi:hypothetical protein